MTHLQNVNTVLELVLQFCSMPIALVQKCFFEKKVYLWQYMLTSLLKQYITKKINLRLYK